MKWRNLAKCLSATSISLLAAGFVSSCAGDKPEPVTEQKPVVEEVKEESQPEREVSVVEEPTVEEVVEKKIEEKRESVVQKPEPIVAVIIEDPEPAPEPVRVEPVQPIVQPVVFKDPDPPQPEPIVIAEKEPEPVAEPEPEPVVADKTEEEQEYERSVKQLELEGITVSHEEFNADKAAVLELIQELEEVMQKEDYGTWLKYLDDDSIKYWSKRSNLQTAQKRLPVKGLRLSNLQDYFKYIFIPSRVGRKVDEIRYETDKHVKVVQIRRDEKGQYEGDTVYYNLRKINGKWKVHLPEIS